MKKGIAVLLALVLALTPIWASRTQAATFTDVPEDYAFDAIERWAAYGVIQGRGNRIFDPNSNATRAEFATMINNIMGYISEAPVGTFTDIPDNAGMNGSVLRAASAGVFAPGGAFRPTDNITRVEATMAILSMLGISYSANDTVPTQFTDDALFSASNRGAIRAATAAGLIQGFPVETPDQSAAFRFGPDEPILRKHLALLFDNIIGALVQNSAPLTGNISGFVIVNHPAATLGANINGNVIVTEGAQGGSISLANTAINGTLLTQTANVSLTVVGDNASLTLGSAVSEATLQGNGITLSLTPGASIATLTTYGENTSLANAGFVGTARLYHTAAESFAWSGAAPANIVIFPEIAVEETAAPPDTEETSEEATDIVEEEATDEVTTGRTRPPMLPIIPPSPPPSGSYQPEVGLPPAVRPPVMPPPPVVTPPVITPPVVVPVWTPATTDVCYIVNAEVVGEIFKFIVIEIQDENLTSQWISGTPTTNQYRILLDGVPREFHRVNLGGSYQYRLALDLIDEGFDNFIPTVQVQIFR